MRVGVTYRLFLAIIVAAALAVLSVFLIMQWSIDRGFIQYLNTLEQGRLEQIAGRLEQAYGEHGSWDFLRRDPHYWLTRLSAVQRGDDRVPGLSKYEGGRGDMTPPPPVAGGGAGPRSRFIILDAQHNSILGDKREAGEVSLRPLTRDGNTIGYVGVLSPRHFLTPPQREFVRRQRTYLVLAACGVAVTVAILSLPLARRLVRPVKAIAAATHDLASGDYSIRVPISSSDELGQLAVDFNAMAEALEKNERARRQWIADISHELRTPLAVLRGEIEALLEGVRTTTPESIRSLHAEVLRLHRLVDDLYQLALSDLGALTYRKEDLNLAEVLSNSIDVYRAEFARKGITLAEDFSEAYGVTVFADRARLSQLFGNLLDNSLKYTYERGTLSITAVYRKGHIDVCFQDSAPAVPEPELERLFDRLYRVEGSRSRASGGAGLGLAISRSIVEGHGGSISARPSPLGGVMITVTLPSAGTHS
jgi:two-component system sensor histidine kinase BaeS